MDEHSALMDEAHHVRQALSTGDQTLAMARIARLVGHLERHVGREEAGIFSALRDKGEFLEELTELEAEHRQFDQTITALNSRDPDFADRVIRLLDDLGEHVEREDLGIFPVSVVSLGAAGWQVVDRARTESPSFLLDPSAPDVLGEPARGPV